MSYQKTVIYGPWLDGQELLGDIGIPEESILRNEDEKDTRYASCGNSAKAWWRDTPHLGNGVIGGVS